MGMFSPACVGGDLSHFLERERVCVSEERERESEVQIQFTDNSPLLKNTLTILLTDGGEK